MEIRDIESVLDEMIKYHESGEAQKAESNADYKTGFLTGLREAKSALIALDEDIKENQ